MGGNSSRGWYRPDHSKTASDGPDILYIQVNTKTEQSDNHSPMNRPQQKYS